MKKDSNTSEKSKILMRTYITSLLSLMLCVTMLLGTTYAWFTSEVQTGGNAIAVGTLKVDLQNGKGDPLKNAGNLFGSGSFKWEPGATKIETFKIVNLGDLAFDYALYLCPINSEVGDLLTAGKFIDVYITTNGAGAKTVEQLKNNWIRVGNLADVAQNGYMLVNGSCITAAKDKVNGDVLGEVKIALHLPSNVSDEDDIMGATITNLGVKLMATQKPFEADDIEGDHDSEAAVVVNVSNQTELAAAFNEGKRVNLTADIQIDENTTLTVPTGKQVVINMNGYSITGKYKEASAMQKLFLVKGNLIINGKKDTVATAAEGESADPYKSVISYARASTSSTEGGGSSIFEITAEGLVQLKDVKVVNSAGEGVKTCVAHLNNNGNASLYTEGCYLEADSCAVRVVNGGTALNNVVAKNTTLKGERALAVLKYTATDFGEGYDAKTVAARLNINIYNNNHIIGDVVYGTQNAEHYVTSGNALVAAVEEGAAKIVLQEDITVRYTVKILEDQTLVLDLNGHKFTQVQEQPANAYAMIENRGMLTIQDSVGTGLISYTDTSEGGEYVSNTISNFGVLNVEGGTIENLSNNSVKGYPHAIDAYQGSVTNITGGTVRSADYDAIRIFCNSSSEVAEVNISGGTIVNRVSFQHPNKSFAAAGKLNITGGTFVSTSTNANVRLLAFGSNYSKMQANITGGTFDRGLAIDNFSGVEVTWKPIKGGSFAQDPTKFVAGEYIATAGEGVWTVAEGK